MPLASRDGGQIPSNWAGWGVSAVAGWAEVAEVAEVRRGGIGGKSEGRNGLIKRPRRRNGKMAEMKKSERPGDAEDARRQGKRTGK
ncbi:hypothetical protein F503_02886 [Ophiostoma piceae UAMH 11346]|uniref:Uncharacterized protein n=1 Tax=Ophiostoma piceae (strain UAMH 11346) TaxID=1262450 RepID=S3BZV6_OPHP1|nr:hypothetical protein F503_02886 [Ophiostoma piceae UAMH 11346]